MASKHLLASLTGAVFASPVFAQESANLPPQILPGVTVTGSNIPRVNGEEASPVQILTADDLARSGYTTVWQVLNNIAANGQGALSQNFSAAAAIGASGISLRGLGVVATLVLINGHRTAPFPVGDDDLRAFVDIASIPFDAVERIEILKDGASAVYGSDAIAGVVNIILRRSFAGNRIAADIGTSYKNDGTQARIAATTGFGDLARDGRNFYIAAEARKQQQIKFSDRGGSFEKTDFTATGGLDVTPGVPNQLNGNLPASATGYVTNTNGQIVGFMPGCDAPGFSAGKCTYTNTWSQIQPRTESYSVLGRFTQRLGTGWQMSLEGSYYLSKSQQAHQPGTAFVNGYQGITSGPDTIPSLLPALPPTSIPDTNPSFPSGTGQRSGLLHYTFLDVGPQLFESDSRSSRLTAELDGTFGTWTIAAAIGLSQVRLVRTAHGLINPANLQSALDSSTAPYLVGQPNSPDVLALIAPVLSTTATSRLGFAHLSGARDLMDLQGGPLSIAVGTDFVRRTQHEVAPAAVTAGSVDTFGSGFAIGTQTVASAYAEAVAPITKQLMTELAVRYDHYNLSGGRLSPKVGVKYVPAAEIGLRATLGRGFRAPGPAENGNAGTTFSTGLTTDPQLCADSGNPRAVGSFPSQCKIDVGTILGSNRALRPETSTSYTFGIVVEPSKGLSLSVDFYAIDLKNQIVLGTQTNTVRGSNFAPLPQVQSDGTIALVVPPVAPIAYYQLGYINANSTKTNGFDIDLGYRHRWQGVGDFKTNFMMTFVNEYDLTVGGTTYRLAGTHGPIVISGDTGNPRTRFRWVNSFSRGAWSWTGTVNYVSSFDLTDPSLGVNDCATGLTFGAGASAYINQLGNGNVPDGVTCRVASLTTIDLTGQYAVSKTLRFQLTVLNVFNAGAPQDWGTYAGSGKPFNPTLHTQGAIGRFFQVGASYAF